MGLMDKYIEILDGLNFKDMYNNDFFQKSNHQAEPSLLPFLLLFRNSFYPLISISKYSIS